MSAAFFGEVLSMFDFDFDNGGAPVSGTGTVTNIDNGVLFTVSSGPAGFAQFENNPPIILGGQENLVLGHNAAPGGVDFTLGFASVANGNVDLISATTAAPIVLDLGSVTGGPGLFSGTWDVTFLTSGGGTGPRFTGVTGNQNLTVTSGTFGGIRFSSSNSSSGTISIDSLSGAALVPPPGVFFDFDNGGGAAAGFGGSSNIADGVVFTISTSNASNLSGFGNNDGFIGNFPLVVSDSAGVTAFTLTLQSNARTSFDDFSGTSAVPIVLNLGTEGGGTQSFVGNWNVTFITESGANGPQFFNVTGNQNLTVTSGNYSGIRFTSTNAGQSSLTVESLTVKALNCFCAGTMIATPRGDRTVEALAPGDVIWTADGLPTRVHWVGRQSISTQMTHPACVNPICIQAGALGGGLPHRDLRLSQDHAVELDGVLYNAGALVNGTTITQVPEMPSDTFAYYHIETDAHELILAEGVAAETYFEQHARGDFDNAETRVTREIAEMDLPRVSSARMVPHQLLENRSPILHDIAS